MCIKPGSSAVTVVATIARIHRSLICVNMVLLSGRSTVLCLQKTDYLLFECNVEMHIYSVILHQCNFNLNDTKVVCLQHNYSRQFPTQVRFHFIATISDKLLCTCCALAPKAGVDDKHFMCEMVCACVFVQNPKSERKSEEPRHKPVKNRKNALSLGVCCHGFD